MIRTNLSTRPFYNERAVHLAIAAGAVLVAALTVWNVLSVISLSRQQTELSTRINSDHAQAEQLNRMAAEIRGRVNEAELQHVAAAAREANTLIDQRTFSWTMFFNHLETTLPPDVMLNSVRPIFKDGLTRVTMIVLGRRAEDIDEFLEKLEATGAFEDVVPAQRDNTESGLFRVVVESIYTAEEAPAEAGETETPETVPAPQTGAEKKAEGAS